jgi:hypothetical protein
MTESRVVGLRGPLFWRALAVAAVLATTLAPAASLPAEAPRSGVVVAAPETTTVADPPASSATLAPDASGPAAGCDAQSMLPDPAPVGATDAACISPDLESDQAYLVETATPGSTMLHQGPALAIVRLHPTFVRRLAGAIAEARGSGLPSAGIYSAYRPPAFGVGGFADKFNSLHSYGLAVDMRRIGGPGSSEARLWYDIAGRHGIVCPYGAGSRREWNHCQPTRVKSIVAGDPLRGTISPPGPVDLEAMFAMGDVLVRETDAGAGPPDLQPAINEKSLNGNQGRPRAQVAAAGRGGSIETGHDQTDPSHEIRRRLGSAAAYPHEAHVQSKRRIVAQNASLKSGPVKKYRIASLVRHESFAAGVKPHASNEKAPAKRIEKQNARLDRVVKSVCRGC